jgi:hypothetical protein
MHVHEIDGFAGKHLPDKIRMCPSRLVLCTLINHGGDRPALNEFARYL